MANSGDRLGSMGRLTPFVANVACANRPTQRHAHEWQANRGQPPNAFRNGELNDASP
jgi:hypothetical protein